jgi:hypothetical protein
MNNIIYPLISYSLRQINYVSFSSEGFAFLRCTHILRKVINRCPSPVYMLKMGLVIRLCLKVCNVAFNIDLNSKTRSRTVLGGFLPQIVAFFVGCVNLCIKYGKPVTDFNLFRVGY